MATNVYKNVREEFKERPIVESFHSSSGNREAFPKEYRSTTFISYARTFAITPYLIDNFQKFSFGTPKICRNIVIPLLKRESTMEERIEKYSDFFCCLYDAGDSTLVFINILFRILAFNRSDSTETKNEVKTLTHFKITVD